MVASVVTGTFFCQFILSRPGLISIYLAGEDKSTKKYPPLQNQPLMSTSSVPMMAMFLLLDKF
jgi:hypothetical protein